MFKTLKKLSQRGIIQEAQLSHRDCAMLRVTEYFAKWFKVIETGTIWKLGYRVLFAFRSNYGSILYYFRDKAH